jgi:hypothetical protein
MKDELELNKVVLLGRTLEEYTRYFALDLPQLKGKNILDVASGVSSFCAEANENGIDVTAFDQIYNRTAEEIQSQCEPDLDFVTAEIGKVKAYKWDFYQSPEGMRKFRERAYKKFLQHFRECPDRYVSGKLPELPFANQLFRLTLVSYLLFVYEDQLDYDFHKRSLLEILRVTRDEVRLYPLVNFRAEPSKFLERVKSDPLFAEFAFAEVTTDFEFLANSNRFLRIVRR